MEFLVKDSAGIFYQNLLSALIWMLKYDKRNLVYMLNASQLAFSGIRVAANQSSCLGYLYTLQKQDQVFKKTDDFGGENLLVFNFGSRLLVLSNNHITWEPNLRWNSTMPPWLKVAYGELGIKEIKGKAHNPRIIEYHSETSLEADTDETPWCSSFLNWCMTKAGLAGSGKATALSWRDWGQTLKSAVYGSIAVINHGDGKGHVGIVTGSYKKKLVLLGGNQKDTVSLAAFNTSKVVAYVVPVSYTVPNFSRILTPMEVDSSSLGLADTR